jgi:hypothetical protein
LTNAITRRTTQAHRATAAQIANAPTIKASLPKPAVMDHKQVAILWSVVALWENLDFTHRILVPA